MEKEVTPYSEINKLVDQYKEGIESIFNDNLIGIYLTGSLSYGGFETNRSDIDLQVVISNPCSNEELEQIQSLHKEIECLFPNWADKLEASYTPISMMNNILPPKETRPFYNSRKFWEKAPYGNEWIINQYQLREHGIVIFGKKPKDIIIPIDMKEVQKACIRDLLTEWVPRINSPKDLEGGHIQSYVVLNICRILYTIFDSKLGSKNVSSEWVKNNLAPDWRNLISEAEEWRLSLIHI